jgi:hypothetical protein
MLQDLNMGWEVVAAEGLSVIVPKKLSDPSIIISIEIFNVELTHCNLKT